MTTSQCRKVGDTTIRNADPDVQVLRQLSVRFIGPSGIEFPAIIFERVAGSTYRERRFINSFLVSEATRS